MSTRFLYCLCIAVLLVGCEQPQERRSGETPSALFTLLSPQATSVNFVNGLTQNLQVNILTYKYFFNGGGVALGDINQDGLCDIYFTANTGPNRLFLNRGNLQFEDITRSAGVDGGQGWTNGATMVDINNDGLLDIYVCRSGNLNAPLRENRLFVNQGNNRFVDMAAQYGLADTGYSTQATFFDYDRDGDLDMYLLNHNVVFGSKTPFRELRNRRDLKVGDKLYKNEEGKYRDVSIQAGIKQNPISYGLGVGVSDLNGDAYPDIYVCNDFTERDYLYMNNGDGTFTESLTTAMGHTSNFSMGVDVADFNNDDRPDVLVLDMAAEDNYRSKTNMSGMSPKRFWKAVDDGFHYQYMVNTLQLNRGNGKFSEVGQLAGVSYTDWSWAPLLADLDNNGWKDILVTTGTRRAFRNNDFIKQMDPLRQQIQANPDGNHGEVVAKMLVDMPEDKLANYVYQNNGDLTFSKKIEAWGLTALSYSNGSALADLDNDGDLDWVVNNIDQTSFIYRNNADQRKQAGYLRIRLRGPEQNRQGIGTKVLLATGDLRQSAELYPSRGYISSMEDLLHFGLGSAGEVDELTVVWPDGKSQQMQKVKANRLLTLDYADAVLLEAAPPPAEEPLMADITETAGVQFEHLENDYDDFAREILLPHRMSTLGPGLTAGDVNGDGLDDFYVGGARKQAGALFVQNEAGEFVRSSKRTWALDRLSEDMDAAFLDFDLDGDMDLYVTSGGSEVVEGSAELRDRLYRNDGLGNFTKSPASLPRVAESSSCVRPFDYDGDGDTDLFVGGRMVPGKYPFPANSRLLRNDGSRFVDVTDQAAAGLERIGMVTSAVWTDVNGDGEVDLILAGEWMPITVMLQRAGQFDVQQNNGLQASQGWWFSLKEADLDGDGDMDFVAGNLGRNYKYKTSQVEPFQVYAHDFDSNGTMDIYLGYFQQGNLFPVRGRECSSQQMPFISDKFKTYDAFAQATLPQVLGEAAADALHYEAHYFASCIVENLGDGTFALRELPVDAQLSAVNGIVVTDVNADERPDLILAGNLYGSEVETPRSDAGLGLVLLNSGAMVFHPLPIEQSGFIADGDVKAIEALQLSGNRRGILVARNNGRVSLLKFADPAP